jgi:hypothetical protein
MGSPSSNNAEHTSCVSSKDLTSQYQVNQTSHVSPHHIKQPSRSAAAVHFLQSSNDKSKIKTKETSSSASPSTNSSSSISVPSNHATASGVLRSTISTSFKDMTPASSATTSDIVASSDSNANIVEDSALSVPTHVQLHVQVLSELPHTPMTPMSDKEALDHDNLIATGWSSHPSLAGPKPTTAVGIGSSPSLTSITASAFSATQTQLHSQSHSQSQQSQRHRDNTPGAHAGSTQGSANCKYILVFVRLFDVDCSHCNCICDQVGQVLH